MGKNHSTQRQYYIQEYNDIINNEKYIDELFVECNKINYNLRKIQLLSKLVNNINTLNVNGESILFIATKNKRLDIIECLIEHGADINLFNNNIKCISQYVPILQTALQYASEYGYLEIIIFLISCGVNVNIQNNYGYTALHFAIEQHKNNVVKYLIEHGANVNLKNKNGDMILHIASRDNLEIVKYLTEYGIDVNLKTNDGNTPLIIASQHGNLDTIVYLVEHGADINITNKYDRTAYNITDDIIINGQIHVNLSNHCSYNNKLKIKQYLDSLNN